MDGVIFYMTSNEDVAAMFGLNVNVKPVLVLLKSVPDNRVVYSEYEILKLITFELLVG